MDIQNQLVSVIMPAYNSELYINEAINSVLDQTYKNWELIIIDDGSTDSTAEIVKKISSQDDRIKYYWQENSGQAKARNFGLKQAKASFIAFIDSDDIWLPEMLQTSIWEFTNDDQDILFSNSYIFTDGKDNPRDLSLLSHSGIHSEKYEGISGLKRFFQQNRISMDGAFGLKDAILNAGGFRDEAKGKAEDYELWLNMLASGYVLRGIDKKLSLIRKHPGSTMATSNMPLEVVNMFQHFFSTHKNINPLLFRNEISDMLGLALSHSKTKSDIFRIYNNKNINTFLFDINCINTIFKLRYFLPIKMLKKIFYLYLKKLDKKYNG